MDQKFLMTKNEETAKTLLAMGYVEIHNSNNTYIFLDTEKICFDNSVKDVVRTSHLVF